MNTAIAQRTHAVRPASPQGRSALTVLPVLGPSTAEPEYRLLEGEALRAVRIEEVSAAGSVPELRVVNELDARVYLMDGQELVGAKQNRILNTDVLVPAKASLTIPVSCVEAGRWHYATPNFVPGKSANYRVRSRKLGRVHDSLQREARHDADQGAVWDEVAHSIAASSTTSASHALHDAYVHREQDLASFRRELRLPDDAVGLAVFRGGRFLGLDLFDRHSTLVYFWESLIDSYTIDWLLQPVDAADAATQASPVDAMLQRAADAAWEPFTAPGEGRE